MSGPQLFNILPQRFIGRPRGPFSLNQASPQARGLVGWWPMERWNSPILDKSLAQRTNLTITNAGYGVPSPNFGHNTVAFNGTSSYAQSTGEPYNNDNLLGVCIWFRMTAPTVEFNRLFELGGFDTSPRGGIGLETVDNGTLRYFSWDSAQNVQIGDTPAVTTDKTHHVFMYSDNNVPREHKFYFDGVQIGATATGDDRAELPADFTLAARNTGPTNNGQAYDFISLAIWEGRTWSDDEVFATFVNDTRYDLYWEKSQRTYIFPAHFPPVAVAGRIMSSTVGGGGLAGPGGIAGQGGGLAG